MCNFDVSNAVNTPGGSGGILHYCYRAVFPNPFLRDPQSVQVFAPSELPTRQYTFLLGGSKNMYCPWAPRTGLETLLQSIDVGM